MKRRYSDQEPIMFLHEWKDYIQELIEAYGSDSVMYIDNLDSTSDNSSICMIVQED